MAKCIQWSNKVGGGGTSFHGHTIVTTINKLYQKFGEPYNEQNDGSDKCNFDWLGLTDGGDVFTIYDWKEYRSIGLNEDIKFHIGAKDAETASQAKFELELIL